jgi:tellurite resistance-related uncharacterized protein
MYEVGDLVEVRCSPHNNKEVMNAVIIEKHSTREQVYRVMVFDKGSFSEPFWRHSLDFARKVA